MLFKVDYTQKTADQSTPATKWVNFASDKTEAVRKFMDWFFEACPDSKVRVDLITEVEFVGDLSVIDAIDAALAK